MEAVLIQASCALIGSIIGAAIAGYLGVRFGISKFVGEKAFERRLDWLEKTIREIITARHLSKQLIENIQFRELPELVKNLNELVSTQETLVLHLSEAELFASGEALTEAQHLRYELSERAYVYTRSRIDFPMDVNEINKTLEDSFRELAETIQLLLPLLDKVVIELVKDARSHLKLEPLKPDTAKTNSTKNA